MVLGQRPTATSLQTLMVDQEVQSNAMNEPISALADGDETKKRILEILESTGMSPSPDISLSLPVQLGGSVDPSTDIASRGADVLNAIWRAADVLRPSITLVGHLASSGHMHPTTRLVPVDARHTPSAFVGSRLGVHPLPKLGGVTIYRMARKVKVRFADALVIRGQRI